MAKYRKRPIVIEAFEWTADVNQKEDPEWIVEAITNGHVWFDNIGTPEVSMSIKTLEGILTATRGDYIIKGVVGEIYPCKPNIFKETYEEV